MANSERTRPRILSRGSWRDAVEVAQALRSETLGGALLVAALLLALLADNTPVRHLYERLRHHLIGPHVLHLDLPLHMWAADGLLAVFFFVAGLELKRELVAGDLRRPARAVPPIVAAVCGVLLPVLVYLAATGADPVLRKGWAIPTATDLAFALALLALVGTHLPSALRAFLLTLAVVDDVIAILIIAVFYTHSVSLGYLFASLVPLAVYAVCVQRGWVSLWLLLPLATAAWVLVHASGLHATVSGVLLALSVPARRHGAEPSLAERFEHQARPFSATFAVPVFAFLASGVSLSGSELSAVVRDRLALGIVLGLFVGKSVGVLGGTWLVARYTPADLDEELAWSDVFGLSLLSGVGFTVSLLIGELAFGADSARDAAVKIAVLAGSLLSALCATVVLRLRNRAYQRISEKETVDADGDGIPDCYAAG